VIWVLFYLRNLQAKGTARLAPALKIGTQVSRIGAAARVLEEQKRGRIAGNVEAF
jgi:hypothetical protein